MRSKTMTCVTRIAAWLLVLSSVLLAACKDSPDNNVKEEEKVNYGISGSEAGNYPVNSDSSLSASFAYANNIANTVQGYYTDGARSHYALKNINTSLVHRLSGFDNFNVTDIANADGVSYANQTLDVYVKASDGITYYAGNSQTAGRMNTTRLGYYYYETHIRDLGFESEVSGDYLYETSVDISGGWGTNDMSAPEYKNGELIVNVTSAADPYVYKNNINISPDQYNAVEIEMKATGIAQTASVYYCTAKSGHFNGEQVAPFKINSDGQYRKYIVKLAAYGYDGTAMTGIRFDMGDSETDTFTIKSVKAVKIEDDSVGYKLDKTFHMYADKLHQEYRLVKLSAAPEEAYNYDAFGVELKIKSENVLQYKIEYEDDGVTAKYAAIDVKDAGIIGFILPSDRTNNISLTEEDGYIVLRQWSSEDTFGSRIYNDATHDYAGIDKAAYEERNPLTNISAGGSRNARAKYLEYDYLRGAYQFTMNGTNFSAAYQKANDYYYSDISIENTSGDDRNIYVWMNGKSGSLECAAVADNTGLLVPIPTQVCKNFQGEIEEPFYDPQDKEYGDTFIPLDIKSGEKLDFTLYHLYQNWGAFPLKQISSIQFHISYYHLSTGVTESNCIAPYFVYAKDQWTLPDFRGCSGIMWAGQPQFNSVGRLRFLSYIKDGTQYMSEYTGSYIRSSGTSYADLDYNYISDSGAFKYTLRHVEFPQNDENRTYYSLRLDFLEDLTIEDVKNNLTLFSFDGRFEAFGKMSYSDQDGEHIEKSVIQFPGFKEIIDIGKGTPYFSYYGLDNPKTEITNFAYIIKDYDITVGSAKWDGHFALRNSFTSGLNLAELSLMEDNVAFKAGDHIYIDFILLPWGTGTSDTDENVQYVIEDSVKNPLKIETAKGSVVEDTYLPEIRAEGNEAEFTLSGGRNRFAIRIDGMTSLGGVSVTELVNGQWQEYVFNVEAYDGYQVMYNEDGTYSYVFIIEMDKEGSARTFHVQAI